MKIDLRILSVVSAFMLIVASALVIVRYADNVNRLYLVEIVPPKGVASTERLPAGMQLKVNATQLSLSFPDCDMTQYQDKFFLHLYTKIDGNNFPSSYVNLDFYLAEELKKEIIDNGRKTCIYTKKINDFSVKQVNIGQFTTPQGRCCEITWSRSFVFDEHLLTGK